MFVLKKKEHKTSSLSVLKRTSKLISLSTCSKSERKKGVVARHHLKKSRESGTPHCLGGVMPKDVKRGDALLGRRGDLVKRKGFSQATCHTGEENCQKTSLSD